jgi:hypothetical protein
MLEINQAAAEIVEAIGYTKQGVKRINKRKVSRRSFKAMNIDDI